MEIREVAKQSVNPWICSGRSEQSVAPYAQKSSRPPSTTYHPIVRNCCQRSQSGVTRPRQTRNNPYAPSLRPPSKRNETDDQKYGEKSQETDPSPQ